MATRNIFLAHRFSRVCTTMKNTVRNRNCNDVNQWNSLHDYYSTKVQGSRRSRTLVKIKRKEQEREHIKVTYHPENVFTYFRERIRSISGNQKREPSLKAVIKGGRQGKPFRTEYSDLFRRKKKCVYDCWEHVL